MRTAKLPPRLRVLIVEDQFELRQVLRRQIELQGFAVDEATNREDGLAMLMGDRAIGIVLLDLGLPPDEHGFSEGIEFLCEARRRSTLTQCIVLTGQLAAEAALKSIEHGATDYLTKPVSIDQLGYALDRARLYYHGFNELLDQAKVPVHFVADARSETPAKDLRDQSMELLLRTVLTETHHNVSEAARRLNVTREHLYYYIKKFDIERDKHLV
jgi:DNA-binding NtrC family response regulator